jgi:hypothetical protein
VHKKQKLVSQDPELQTETSVEELNLIDSLSNESESSQQEGSMTIVTDIRPMSETILAAKPV